MRTGCVPPGAWAGEGLCSRRPGQPPLETALCSRLPPSPASLPAATSGAHASRGLGGGGQPGWPASCAHIASAPGPSWPHPSPSLHICAAQLAGTLPGGPPSFPAADDVSRGGSPSPEPLAQLGRRWLPRLGAPRGTLAAGLTFVGVGEPDLGGGGVRAAVGLVRGRGGGAAGVRGGRGAQAAGEEAAHERGGRGGAHQAAAGCGHRGKGQAGRDRASQEPSAVAPGPQLPGFIFKRPSSRVGEAAPSDPGHSGAGSGGPGAPVTAETSRTAPPVTQPTHSHRQVPGAARGPGRQTAPGRCLGAEPPTPRPLARHTCQCFAHDSRKGQVSSTPRGPTLLCGHQGPACPHSGTPNLLHSFSSLTHQTGVPGSR